MNNGSEDNNVIARDRSFVEMPPTAAIASESLVQILWRGRWIILLATIVALAAGFAYLQKVTPMYRSSSKVYVEQTGPRIITDMEEGVMTQSSNYLYTQAELLKSTPILAAAVESPGMRQLETFSTLDNPIAYLMHNLTAVVGKNDDIIRVSLDSPYPADAAQLVNQIVDSYITFNSTRKQSTSAEVLKILQDQQAKRNKELSENLRAMLDFKRENVSLAFDGSGGNIILQRLERLSSAWTEAELVATERKSAYESVKKLVGDPAKLKRFMEAQQATGGDIATDSENTALRSKLEELQLSTIGPLYDLTPAHPDIKAIERQSAHINAKIAELDAEFVQAQLALAEQQYLVAKEKQDVLAKYVQDQRQQAIALNEQLAQFTILQSEWEQTKKLCDIINDRIKELNITEDVGALNISILEVARPSTTPVEPQKARTMGIALVAGLMLGCGLTLVRDWMDQRLRSAEEVSTMLGAPVLGVVPSMSKMQGIVARGQKVHLDSDSRTAEAYRTIRTAVFFGAPKDEARTVLVTSPAPLDGKTTLVSNLAIAMAQAGQKTIILDADFRKPMQHKIFKLNHQDAGLGSVLAGTTTLEEAIQPTEVEGLQVLPAGPPVTNPSEMLNSQMFTKLLQRLSQTYDRVVIDSPPVMSVTDAQILGAICDRTLVVLRAEKSTRKISQQAREGLLSVGAHILGAVVNDVRKRNGRYGSYSGYGYYYGNYGSGRRRGKRNGNGESVAREKAARVTI